MKTLEAQGFTTRPPTLEDAAAVAKFVSHCWRIVTNRPELIDAWSEHELRTDWSEPGFDLSQQACVVVAADGEIVAVADHNASAPFVKFNTWTHVHPDFWGRGIGTWLTEWHINQSNRFFAQAPSDARLVITASIPATHTSARPILFEHGFEHYRSFYDMKIELEELPPAPLLPAGIAIRTMVENQDEEALYRAKDEAWRDHIGWVETPFEQGFAAWKHEWHNNEFYDPTLMFMAVEQGVDGEQIAGLALCTSQDNEDPEMGWISTVAVRRAWRRQGLAVALLRHAFGEFYRRGKKRAGLAVDSSSRTGALRLYERAEMRVYNTFDSFEKEVRSGVDLVTR